MSWWQSTILSTLLLTAGYLAGWFSVPAGGVVGRDITGEVRLTAVDTVLTATSSAPLCAEGPGAVTADTWRRLDERLDAQLQMIQTEIRNARSGYTGPDPTVAQPAFDETREELARANADYRYERAQAFVSERVALGVWQNADREDFRDLLHTLEAEDADRVLGALFAALNDGLLEIGTEGPPL
jgi:hypothetical protein